MTVHMGMLSPAIIEDQIKILNIDLPQKILIKNQIIKHEER